MNHRYWNIATIHTTRTIIPAIAPSDIPPLCSFNKLGAGVTEQRDEEIINHLNNFLFQNKKIDLTLQKK